MTDRDQPSAGQIATRRTTLRRTRPEDFDALWAIWSEAAVLEGLIRRPQSPEEFQPMFQVLLDEPDIWLVEDSTTGEVLGRAGFLRFGEERIPEIAYLLKSAVWGLGLATEVVAALLEYAFALKSWPRVVAVILPHNARSQAVVRKFGFAIESEVEIQGRLAQVHGLTAAAHGGVPPPSVGTQSP